MWPRHRWGAGMGQEGRGRPGGGHAGLHQTMGMYGCMSIYMDEYRRLSKVYKKKRCKM